MKQSHSVDERPVAESRLIPMLARALDLGRGPPGLVSWVRSQLPAPPDRECPSSRRGSLLRQLASELSRLLPQAGFETILDPYPQRS